MAELKLQQKQAQQLVMTQQLRQSIELLQMNSLELEAFVAGQLAENPILTNDAEEGWESKESGGEGEASGESEADGGDDAYDGDDRSYDDWEVDSGTSGANMGYGDGGDAMDPLSQQANPNPSLKDHLRNQWIMEVDEGTARMIGLYLIDTLDDKGYLGESL
ncbi:hypothetical protein GC177_02155, partial [bacterium]|nr:hypothetical protein [bacterium]